MNKQMMSSDEMYGISKRINRELEEFPLHTHSAIVEMVRVGMQHRQLSEQAAAKELQEKQQERIIAIKEHEMARHQEAADRKAAGGMNLVGDTPPN